MYQIGDYIIYGDTGVCEVADITTPDLPYVEENQLFYMLRPLYQDGIIYTPVSTKAFSRPVISKEEAERLIDSIPTVHVEIYHNRVLKQLSEHYEFALKTHDCLHLLELAMSINAKRRSLEEQNHKLGQIDERFMKRAEELLCGEFSVALGIPKEKVQEYITSRLKAINKAKKDPGDPCEQ